MKTYVDQTAASAVPVSASRRSFLKASLTASGVLIVGFPLFDAAASDATALAPDAFIRIFPDNRIVLVLPQVEMGQGTYTSLPMLVAEELEVDLTQLTLEHAPPGPAYNLPLFGVQMTGGSTSIRGFYKPFLTAGATTRTMLVEAAANQWKVDPATCVAERGTVIHKASGRKATYGSLTTRAATIAPPKDVVLKDPRNYRIVGKPAHRLDTRSKVDGTAKYGIDAWVDEMKFATVAASPVFGGKLVRVDDAKAKQVKGVRQVVRLDDAVAVIGDHMWAAKQGLAALDITWDEGPNATMSTQSLTDDIMAAAQKPGATSRTSGDVDAALAGATVKMHAVYELPFLAHATMEPVNCTVHVTGDRCEIWVGNQVLGFARAAAAAASGLPPEKVVIHNHLLGCGFGRRLEVDYIVQAVQIGKQFHGPIKVVWTREEDMQHDYYRGAYVSVLDGALDSNGMPAVFKHRVVGPSIIARMLPFAMRGEVDPDGVDQATGPYDIPNVRIEYLRKEPPAGLHTGFWRGVGPTHNLPGVECFIDEMAAAAKVDPVKFRLTILSKDQRAANVLRLAAAKSGWDRPMPPGSGRGVALMLGFGTYIAQVAEVEIGKDQSVKVTRLVCALDCGRAVNPDTIEAQIEGGAIFGTSAALLQKITFKDGRVEQSNFHDYPTLRMNEAPAVQIYRVDSDAAPGGIGEVSTAITAPAILNAVYAATGKRLRRLPVDLKTV